MHRVAVNYDFAMTSSSSSALLQSFQDRARTIAYPMEGGGTMVWRGWGQGEPLVLLHGGHGSWNHWIRNIDALSLHRTVWAPDLPGFGDSDKAPGCEDADTLWRPVAQAIIEVAGGPADVVGFSFGSMVAGYLAGNRPDLVRRLGLVGAPGLGVRRGPVRGLMTVRGLTDPAEIAAAHRTNLLIMMLHSPQALDELALLMQTLNVPRDRMPRRRLSRTDALKQLSARWACPVMGIWGREDALFAGGLVAQIEPALSVCDMRSFHIVPETGHWLQYERAELFNRELIRFLSDTA